MKKEFAILGLGKFGISLASSLSDAGCGVMVADHDIKMVDEAADYVTHAVVGDITDGEFLASLGLSDYEAVIIGIGDELEAGVMGTMLAKELGAKFIIAKAGSDLQAKILRKVGADKVVFPERESGIRIANQLVHGNYFDAVELSDRYSIMDFPVPGVWVGKSFSELGIRTKHKVNIIGIRRNEGLVINPAPDEKLTEDDTLIVLGDNMHLDKLRRMDKL